MLKADVIIYSDAVFTAADKDGKPFSGGIAVKDDKIIAVGSKEVVAGYGGADTQIYNCGADSLLMPAFNDGHQHLRVIIAEFNGVPLKFLTSEDACIESAVVWEKAHPEYEWVFGMGWQFNNWDSKKPPTNEKLNAAFPDKPVCLLDVDCHAVWLNDCALQQFGITKDSEDPQGSIIERYPDGTPTGYVQEAITVEISTFAMGFMEKDANIMKKNLIRLLKECNSHGLTGVSDMLESRPQWLDIYEELAARHELTCRISVSQDYWADKYLVLAHKLKQRFPNPQADVAFYSIKCYLDGVGIGHTAWQLQPYNDRPGCCGEPILPEAELKAKVMTAIATGDHIHIHACGDKSVHKALDWWEEARDAGLTKPEQRFTITHNDVVSPSDFTRFSQLGVVASMQPDMLAPSLKWKDNLYPQIYGNEICKTSWPCRSFLDADAVLAFSTDAPVGSVDPMYNIYRAVTRVHADGLPKGGFVPDQKITLSNALWAYTYGDAYQQGKEDFLGTLDVGKKADITVLNKNLFEADTAEYIGTEAMLTLFNGKVVYENIQ